MTIIVEDGTAKVDAETYISVVDADTYHANRGNTVWTALSTAVKEQLLRKAADYIEQAYRSRWKGIRTTSTQALDWPRQNVSIEDVALRSVLPSNMVPSQVMRACAELAYRANAGELAPDIEPRVTSEQVGPISVSYDTDLTAYVTYRAVDNMLRMLLSGGSTMTKLVRT